VVNVVDGIDQANGKDVSELIEKGVLRLGYDIQKQKESEELEEAEKLKKEACRLNSIKVYSLNEDILGSNGEWELIYSGNKTQYLKEQENLLKEAKEEWRKYKQEYSLPKDLIENYEAMLMLSDVYTKARIKAVKSTKCGEDKIYDNYRVGY